MTNKEKFITDMKGKLGNDIFVTELANKLEKIDFFVAPASINHHGNHDGGLYEHCSEVTFQLLYLTNRLDLTWNRPESPYIVGMLHDLCKCDDYVKRPDITKWESDNLTYDLPTAGHWEYNKNGLLPGHGEKSVIMAQNIYGYLTEEEIMCIRWHMGAFDDKANWQYYSGAVAKYPNVLFTHTADMIASQISTI